MQCQGQLHSGRGLLKTRPIDPDSQGLTGEAEGYKVHLDEGHLDRGHVTDESGGLGGLVGVGGVREEVREEEGQQ